MLERDAYGDTKAEPESDAQVGVEALGSVAKFILQKLLESPKLLLQILP